MGKKILVKPLGNLMDFALRVTPLLEILWSPDNRGRSPRQSWVWADR